MGVSQAYNFLAVDERVATAGVLSPEQLSALEAEGYQAVINLLPEDNEYAVAGERELVQQQGLEYHYIPVDFAAPTASDYQQFEKAMAALAGRKLLIHCAANYRVSAFYAIYAHRQLGWPADQARVFIQTRWNPADYPHWPAFIDSQLC